MEQENGWLDKEINKKRKDQCEAGKCHRGEPYVSNIQDLFCTHFNIPFGDGQWEGGIKVEFQCVKAGFKEQRGSQQKRQHKNEIMRDNVGKVLIQDVIERNKLR